MVKQQEIFLYLLYFYKYMEYVIIIITFTVVLVLLYGKYEPHIDIIKRTNKHTIILWYNKKVFKDEIIRTYIKLFEYET